MRYRDNEYGIPTAALWAVYLGIMALLVGALIWG